MPLLRSQNLPLRQPYWLSCKQTKIAVSPPSGLWRKIDTGGKNVENKMGSDLAAGFGVTVSVRVKVNATQTPNPITSQCKM